MRTAHTPKKIKPVSYANRGMGLESIIEYANQQYAAKGLANIKKVSTPWKVTRDRRGNINNAFPEGPSTVDFMGDYNGRSICFEAKQTLNETRFPMANFEDHQIEFMRAWKGHKFALIEFTTLNKIYYCTWEFISAWWDEYKGNGRKSIPHESFAAKCPEVKKSMVVVLDYLEHVEASA